MATKQVRKPGRPAKKTRRSFAAGGVVRLEQGEKVPKPEWKMDPRAAVAVDSRQQWQNPTVNPAPPMSGGNMVAEPARPANPSYAARPGMRAAPIPAEPRTPFADAAASARRGMSLTSDGNPTGNPDAGAPVTGQGYDRALDRGYGAVEAAVRGGRAAGNYGQRMMQPMDNPDAGAPVTGQRSPLPGAVTNYVQRMMQPMDNPDAGAPVTGQRSPPARVAGTIGRIGRGPVTDEDLFTPAEAAPVASPGLAPPPGYDYSSKAGTRGAPPAAAGAVPPSAPNNAYGTQEEILGEAKRGLKAQRTADAVSPERVAAARRQAQFEERNIARDRGQGWGSQGSGQGFVAATRATADNALLQKWYSMSEKERGRMPASVENAKYRGADDTETAFNVARARIMETRMDPGRQAQALANLDKTRADMLNQSQQTRQTGEYQQGQLGNERERTGVARQQVEQTGQNQQAQMAHQQRMAQITLDQGYAQGLFTPDEPFNDEAAKNLDNGAAYIAAFEERRAAREAAKKRWSARILAGETPEQIMKSPGEDAGLFARLLNPAAGMLPRKYAGGGMVSPQAPVYGGAPDAQRADPLINAYRVYTTQSKAMGAPTVPFAEFSSLYAGAAQGPMQPPVGMAGGGAVPAAGKMVIDTDPNARTDSIPAMIDGEQPAALNSGEFVFPTDVTSYYGTKMLSGMIEKARQGANGSKPSGRSAEAV